MIGVYLFANKFLIVVIWFFVKFIEELSDVNFNKLIVEFTLGNVQLVWKYLIAFDLLSEVYFVEY